MRRMNGKGMETILPGEDEQQNGPQTGWMGAENLGTHIGRRKMVPVETGRSRQHQRGGRKAGKRETEKEIK